ncbi:hypothetical protein [Lactovum miscens]|uniref:Uncharacterized protein n=1 Tax=Lactovum miscens TaxID=190387 RepID=A0A841C9Y8_9LACT|nr:hypothetical protein [Lactovum miscens]MBB5888381.1 hypothetical protein [Lactovum miscens]
MTYSVKITYPKEESALKNRMTERRVSESLEELETDQVVEEYEKCLTKGYSVTTTFNPPTQDKKGGEPDPFAIAQQFELSAIPYKATLKLKASGTFEVISKIAKLIEINGFDYDVSLKLKISETSPVDFEKEATWFDHEYAKYTIFPKASSSDIDDLKSLYDALVEMKQEVKISLKAKVRKDSDEEFASQLSAYPEDTTIVLKLSDADVYGEE